MKSLTKFTICLSPVFGAFLPAQAAFSIADKADVKLTSEAGFKMESNPLLVSSEGSADSDTSFYYTPGVEITLGTPGASAFDASAMYRYHMYSYMDNNDLDAQNNEISIHSTYKGGMVELTGGFTYLEAQTNTDLSGYSDEYLQAGRISRNILGTNLYASMGVTPLTRVGAGISYNDQNYVNSSGYQDSATLAFPVDFYYSLSPKVDLTVDYQYRSVYEGAGHAVDAVDNSLMVGLSGEITPKLTGYIRGGLMSREDHDWSGSGSGNTDVTFSGVLAYSATPLLNLKARVNRDYSTSPFAGSTTLRTGAGLDATYKIADAFTAGANIVAYRTDYSLSANRHDSYNSAGLSVGYQPNEFFNFSVAYNYCLSDSNKAAADYDNSILQVSASVRF